MTNNKELQRTIDTCLELIRQEDETIESVLARFPDQADQIRPALEAALWLKQKQASIEPRPGFVAASSKRMTAQIQQAPSQAAGPLARLPGQSALRQALRQPLLRLMVLLTLLGSVLLNGYQAVQATRTCLPGDLVYPLKISQENLQLAFTSDPAGAARLHTRFAQYRLLEVQALVLEGRYEQIPATVSGFENHVSKAIQAIAGLAPQDQEQALNLADDLQIALTSQTGLVTILSGMAPQDTRQQFERVKLISEQGLIQVEGLLLPGSWRPGAPGPFEAESTQAKVPGFLGQAPYNFVRRMAAV